MGPAHSSIENRTSSYLCVITFNKTDLLFNYYNNLYILEPGQKLLVEANPDPVGLYVAVVYKAADGFLHFKRWLCQNEAEMVVLSVNRYDIDVSGGNHFFALCK